MSQFREQVTHVLMIIVIGFILRAVGGPWYIGLATVIAVVPLLAAIEVGTKTTPTVPPLVTTDPSDARVPTAARLLAEGTVHRLKDSGLQAAGPWLCDPNKTAYAVLQHPQTLDIAIIQCSERAVFAQCVRRRGDGSRLETEWLSGSMNWPHDARDNHLTVYGNFDPMCVWKLHLERIAQDPMSVANSPITDTLIFLSDHERREANNLIAMGYRTRVGNDRMRATISGAMVMAARMFSPWTLVLRYRGSRAIRGIPT